MGLGDERLAAHFGGLVGAAQPADVLAHLDSLHAADVYVACAAGTGVASAAEALVAYCGPMVVAYVRAVDKDDALVDEVRQSVLHRLLTPESGPPRILTYGGRAPLPVWVGIAAQRSALSVLRSDGARARALGEAAREPWLGEQDPELRYLRERYKDAFEAAVVAAIAELPPRERALVRLQTVGGMTLAQMAPLYGVEESTVSRWLLRVRRTILEATQRKLSAAIGVDGDEFRSIARLVASQLDVSVARLLAQSVVVTSVEGRTAPERAGR